MINHSSKTASQYVNSAVRRLHSRSINSSITILSSSSQCCLKNKRSIFPTNNHLSIRRVLSSSAASTNTNSNTHEPPLLGRIALVSSTTALATPSFPALGLLYGILRLTVSDVNARRIMEGQLGTLLSFTTWTLLPKLYSGAVTSLIVPCALSNAMVAGCTYGMLDILAGGPKGHYSKIFLDKPHVTGAGIGATVGYIAPNYVYGPVMEHVWQLEGMNLSMECVMSVPFATEVSVVTGAIAGTILHPLLYYPVHGIHGVHWGIPVAAASSVLYFIYYGREEAGLPVPDGSYMEPSKLDWVDSILRYNTSSGMVETYSLKSGQFVGSPEKCLEGRVIAEASRSYSSSSSWGNHNKKVVFDDRFLAFVYNFWDAKTAEKYPDHVVTNIPSVASLQEQQDAMLLTDASVATILKQNDLKSIQAAIHGLDYGSASRKPLFTDEELLKDVNTAIEALLHLQQASEQVQEQYIDELPKLEKFILRRSPKLVLYSKDERHKGESIESQLIKSGWKGSDLPRAMKRWHHVQEESYKSWRKRVVLATGVIVSIGCSLLFSR